MTKIFTSVLICIFVLSFKVSTMAQDEATNQANVIAAVAPVYPVVANAARAIGDVVVEIELTANGQIKKTEAISGHPLLRLASEKAAKRWKFEGLNNNQISHRLRLIFSFNLLDKSGKDGEVGIIFFPPYKVAITALITKVKTTPDYRR